MKVVLSYSGGLDTSVCIPLLKEKYGFDEVVTVTVDIGQPEDDVKRAEERGKKYADKHFTVNARKEYVEMLFKLIKANGDYEGYVLGTSIARPVIAEKIVEVAKAEKADAIAHGCTGKGNDQLRFENIFYQYGFRVIAPMRELNLTREWEIEYAKQHGIDVGVTKEKPYSIDENLWSRSVEGGKLEDPSYIPPNDIYKWTVDGKDEPEILKIDFEKGIPVAINDERMDGFELIKTLNEIGGKHGVGRTDMMEDRVLGLKARENYEHPAATILITAHRDLEKLVLSRRELKFKKFVEEEWAEVVYYGLINDPIFDALNAFIDKTQERVTGWVKVRLFKGSVLPVARYSDYSLYVEELTSFDTTTVDQKFAEGFSRFHGLQGRLYKEIIKKLKGD
ncbi:argininosuccinate synthase [Archaeoglobales archaeon]|nr:MAG: argininosuccinate synthase [Archaeoglobales archaeon]RLI80462.1 MAG: argininosuccinate synthase [Archaeoglobales archaeon]